MAKSNILKVRVNPESGRPNPCQIKVHILSLDDPDYDGLDAEDENEGESNEGELQRSSICTYNGVEYRSSSS